MIPLIPQLTVRGITTEPSKPQLVHIIVLSEECEIREVFEFEDWTGFLSFALEGKLFETAISHQYTFHVYAGPWAIEENGFRFYGYPVTAPACECGDPDCSRDTCRLREDS